MRAIALLALLAASLLAGCSGPSEAPAEPGPRFDGHDLVATPTTGVLRGVVVDEAIRPVAGASVRLLGDAPREAATTAEGTFGFDGLAPGNYFLSVAKPGYAEARQSAEVVAGVAEPPAIRVLLAADPSTAPFVESFVFEGFIECSGTFVLVGAAVCSMPSIVTGELGLQNLTQDEFGVRHALAGKPTWLQSEMVWQSTQALGSSMNLQYAWDCGETLLCEHEASGGSPLLLVAGPEDLESINGGDFTQPVFVRAFNEGLAETQGLVGATVQQRFTVYTHAFHGFQPPEGWRLSSGEPVPQPQV